MIYKIIPGYYIFKYFLNKIKYKTDIKIGYKTNIHPSSNFEGGNEVLAYSYYKGKMGYGSYISAYCNITANIGRFTSIAPGVQTVSGVHPIKEPFSTTSPYFYSLRSHTKGHTFATECIYNEFRYADEKMKVDVLIGNDCWIGYESLIVAGVTIGDGAVVLARSVVTKDVPPYAIVGGVPAKVIGYRYSEDKISMLINKKWWDKPIDWLKDNWRLFADLDKLINEI